MYWANPTAEPGRGIAKCKVTCRAQNKFNLGNQILEGKLVKTVKLSTF